MIERLREPDSAARIMMRWWWFGPAVDRDGIDRELRVMSEAGIGGVEVQPVYSLCRDGQLDGVAIAPFMSAAFLDLVRFAAERAQALGMWMDLTLGSGWPFGGPHIRPEEAARGTRIAVVPVEEGATTVDLPQFAAAERPLAAVVVNPKDESVVAEFSVDSGLSQGLDEPAEKELELRVLVATPSGGGVKYAAVGAEGAEIDHYDAAAFRRHAEVVGERLLDAAGRDRIRAVFCDSLEIYENDWTGALFEEFERRRGYDLRSHLAALFAGAGDAERRIRRDYGKTLTELLEENFLKELQDFARENGVLSRVQAYGAPPAALSSYKYVDLPEGEAARASDVGDIRNRADWTEITPNRLASSAARRLGENVVSAEIWTWLHSPPFAATPLDVKTEADQYFLQGINRFVGHGWPYSPPQAGRLGWIFYAAADLNDRNPWFPVMPDMCRYFQIVSSGLSLGKRMASLAIYLPEHDAWADFKVRDRIREMVFCKTVKERIGDQLPVELLKHGCDFDLIDDEGILALANGDDDYLAVILPDVERIPVETAEALAKFARRGVVAAVGRTPDRSPGHFDAEPRSATVKRIMEDLFSGDDDNALRLAGPADLRRLRDKVKPPVRFDRPLADVGCVQRTMDEGDLFFFVNTGNEAVSVSVTINLGKRNATRWDPLSDAVSALVGEPGPGERTFPLSFAPFESFFIIVSDDDPEPIPKWKTETVMDLSRGWRVRFTDTGVEKAMDELEDWTALPETRHYSGEAVYEKTIDMPENFSSEGRRAVLSLSECRAVEPYRVNPDKRNMGHVAFADAPVKDGAVAFVNGERVGAFWAPPYRLDLTGQLKPGENRLELKVYNRLVNHIANLEFDKVGHPYGGDFRGVVDIEFAVPESSGLTGEVRLIVESAG